MGALYTVSEHYVWVSSSLLSAASVLPIVPLLRASSRLLSGLAAHVLHILMYILLSVFLTLIQPGKVKVDLANFDVKFQTKFLYIRFFLFDLFLQNCLPNLFELLT